MSALSSGTPMATTNLGFLREHTRMWRISGDPWDTVRRPLELLALTCFHDRRFYTRIPGHSVV